MGKHVNKRFKAGVYRFDIYGVAELDESEFVELNLSQIRHFARIQEPFMGYFWCFRREDGKFYTGARSGVELPAVYDKVRTT